MATSEHQPSAMAEAARRYLRSERNDKLTDPQSALAHVAAQAARAGFLTITGGNLSVRAPGDKDGFWITPTQVDKAELRPEMMVLCSGEGADENADGYRASSEYRLHAALYDKRPDIHAVMHSHGAYATALVLTETPFLPISTEAALVGELPRVPYTMPGTAELAERVAGAMAESQVAVLMQNHGLIVAARSLSRALAITDIIESTAKKIMLCLTVGKSPATLDAKSTQALREIGKDLL